MHVLTLLRKAGIPEAELAIVDSVMVRAFGSGEATGPSPDDRRQLGTRHTLVVDGNGVPLAIHTAPANASDHGQILPAVADFPRVPGKRGRPRSLRMSSSRIADTTAKQPGTPCVPRESSRSSLVEERITEAASDEYDGWSSERSVGSRVSAASESATTDSPAFSTPGMRSPQP
jgi:hypothetical protein